MDTALITFMIQTTPSTQSVHLTGSWDNFTKRYPMERDVRRARGQWRGCYAFEDIICDGEGKSNPKRTGGLKMGSTYYYYYELDGGTEHFDKSIPFTTSCPYLPGQPVNLLWVPIEVQPLRYRSASMSSMTNGDLKTMNPADKFMAPRPPPPTPDDLPRLNTSTSVLAKKRSTRSLSPQPGKSGWAPRAFFGLRSPPAIPRDSDRAWGQRRGRSHTTNASSSNLLSRSEEMRISQSVPHTRDSSPQSLRRMNSRDPARDPSPLRQLSTRGSGNNNAMGLEIPDEIAEEGEDDDNFASQLERISLSILTPLSPPPSSRPSTHDAHPSTDKPLPQLPEPIPPYLLPNPLRLRTTQSVAELPRSHFSTSTISTVMSSPTESHFDFSENETQSLGDEDVDLTADLSGDDFAYSPILSKAVMKTFSGYSLPEGEYTSEQTLRKDSPPLPLGHKPGERTAFGSSNENESPGDVTEPNMSSLESLLSEMGYLGNIIVQK